MFYEVNTCITDQLYILTMVIASMSRSVLANCTILNIHRYYLPFIGIEQEEIASSFFFFWLEREGGNQHGNPALWCDHKKTPTIEFSI